MTYIPPGHHRDPNHRAGEPLFQNELECASCGTKFVWARAESASDLPPTCPNEKCKAAGKRFKRKS